METQKNIDEPKSNTGASKGGGRKQSGGGAKPITSHQGAPQGDAQVHTDRVAESGTQADGGTETHGSTSEKPGNGQNLLQQAKQTTGEVMNQVQQRASSQLTRQKESTASDLSAVVDAVRRFGESLAGEQNGPIARYAAQYGDKAANNLERLSNYIREQDPKQLLDDVQDFGRRRPAWLLGGALLLGFAGARLIKSSLEAGSQQQFHSNAMAPNVPPPAPNAR
jgi:hypothetical protein